MIFTHRCNTTIYVFDEPTYIVLLFYTNIDMDAL